ncbi:hypothetical protein D1AOALGA4SA_12493 [Olavius algarvensis Delta 1 endosymbiont]|nr:hypothetical protein D1AOALGA4SA_12493 [Olavius algarvensis Delta 1 endosymbiont]
MGDSTATRNVISLASWINKIIVTGLVFSLAVVASKLTAGATFKVPGTDVQLKTGYAWIVFAVFTVAHAYVTILFVRACRYLFREDHANAKSTWKELSRNGPLFFRDMMPRLLSDGSRVAIMRWDDMTTWLAHAAAMLIFAAMVPFSNLTTLGFVPAVVLTFINWLLGGKWVIAASELSSKRGMTRLL